MPVTEVQKLRVRLQQVGSTNNNNGLQNPANNNVQNNLPAYRNNMQDTGLQRLYNNDTINRRPLINARIFGAELFNNPTLNFQPSVSVATPVNYVIGPGDQLNISVYGVQETNIPVTVSPEGNISIPNVKVLQFL